MNTVDLVQTLQVRDQSSWIEIDRDALRHNLAQIAGLTFPNAGILAMVKANAYGHGLLEISRSIADAVSCFGVASLEEALALRRLDGEKRILLFGVLFGEAVDAAIRERISLAVSSWEQAEEISKAAARLKTRAAVHVKIDTGMGRLGIPKRFALESLVKIAALDFVTLEGIFTHFPQGEDEEDPFTKEQIRAFDQLVLEAESKGIHFAYRHAANSAGMVNHPQAHFNLVRPGLSLYGLLPHPSLKRKLALKPVLSWRARMILMKRLAAGESTGYARTFVAERGTWIGILPVGYSHGYPFSLSNCGAVLFRGRRYPVAGRVSMDYLAVNFGHEGAEAKTGDWVTLLGREGSEEVSAEELARRANTIPYEVFTRLSPSVPRLLVSG